MVKNDCLSISCDLLLYLKFDFVFLEVIYRHLVTRVLH